MQLNLLLYGHFNIALSVPFLNKKKALSRTNIALAMKLYHYVGDENVFTKQKSLPNESHAVTTSMTSKTKRERHIRPTLS